MAITLHSGLLKHKVIFQRPIGTVGDEGEQTRAYENEVVTFAHIKDVSQNRAMEPQGSTLTDAKDFFIRYASDRAAINKDWLISYKNKSWVISEIENVDEKTDWIRIRAKVS